MSMKKPSEIAETAYNNPKKHSWKNFRSSRTLYIQNFEIIGLNINHFQKRVTCLRYSISFITVKY